jgi:hypothetical protein
MGNDIKWCYINRYKRILVIIAAIYIRKLLVFCIVSLDGHTYDISLLSLIWNYMILHCVALSLSEFGAAHY